MSDRQGASQSEQVPASPPESEPSSDPDALIDFQMSPHGLGLMGQRQQVRDHIDLIKTAVDASPTKVAVVGVRVTEGEKGFGKFDLKNSDSFDHVLIAYYDNNKQEYVVAEMMPGEGSDPEDPYSRLFGSESNPSTLQDTARMWDRFVAAPVALTPEQDALLRDSVAKNMSGGNTYSFFSEEGNTCASGVRKVLVDAKVWDWTEQGFWAGLEKVGVNVVQPGTVVEWAAQRSGVVYDSQIYARTSWPDGTDGGHDKLAQPAADGDTGASRPEQAGPASDTENARIDDAGSRQSGADHDQDASQAQAATASDSGNARINDAAMPKAATAEISVDPTVHDQAGPPQVATSAPVIADDGFSFSAFVKPGAGSGTPESESAHSDAFARLQEELDGAQRAADKQTVMEVVSSPEGPTAPYLQYLRSLSDHDAPHAKSARTTFAKPGVSVEVTTLAASLAWVSPAFDHVPPAEPRDPEEGPSHSQEMTATSAPFSAGDRWSSSMFASQEAQPRQPATNDFQEGSQKQRAIASDREDALTDDAAQQPATDKEEALASNPHGARTDDDVEQPAINDDEASQGPVALTSVDEDARTDDDASRQPAIDDDEDASPEQVAIASDPEETPADDAAMAETAKADVEVDPASGEQAGAQVATSVPMVPDEGFSFSLFAKPGVPLEVVNQALPAEQASPAEESSGSGVPAGESALPDVGSEDVGNAAPTKEPVVHHGDLAP